MFLAVAVVSKSFFLKKILVFDTVSVLVVNGRLSWI